MGVCWRHMKADRFIWFWSRILCVCVWNYQFSSVYHFKTAMPDLSDAVQIFSLNRQIFSLKRQKIPQIGSPCDLIYKSSTLLSNSDWHSLIRVKWLLLQHKSWQGRFPESTEPFSTLFIVGMLMLFYRMIKLVQSWKRFEGTRTGLIYFFAVFAVVINPIGVGWSVWMDVGAS